MNFREVDYLLCKQAELLKALRENSQSILVVAQRLLDASLEQEHPASHCLQQICDVEKQFLPLLESFSPPSRPADLPENQQEVDVYFQRMSGEVLSMRVSRNSSTQRFHWKFLRENGYNAQIDWLYFIQFFYEDKTGEQRILDRNDRHTWFERFGTDIPTIHFIIEDNLTDKKRQEIVSSTRKYMKQMNVTTDMDDETMYNQYRDWFMTHNTSGGEIFFIEQCPHLFQPI
jgi:hypothetical protein